MTDALDTAITKSSFTGSTNNTLVSPASGSLSGASVSGLSGPWYVERQTLDIYYYRVPHSFGGVNPTVTLQSATTPSSVPVFTNLTYYAVATYDTNVVYQNFSTSSTQQPQEFTVNAASADANGVNYGAITSATMGAMGSIITTTPYIRRTLYTGASSQPLVSKVATGSNFAAVLQGVSGAGISTIPMVAYDGTQYLGDLAWFKDQGCMPHTARYGHPYNIPAGNSNPIAWKMSSDYSIPGAFDTAKESLAQIQTFIDNVAVRVTNENHFNWPVANVDLNTNQPVQDNGFVEYDINRHA